MGARVTGSWVLVSFRHKSKQSTNQLPKGVSTDRQQQQQQNAEHSSPAMVNVVTAVRAVSARALFIGHALVTLVEMGRKLETEWMQYVYIVMVVQAIEPIFSCTAWGKECCRGICPVVSSYLVIVIPSFWLRMMFVGQRALASKRVYRKDFNCSAPYEVETNHFRLFGRWYVIPRVLDNHEEELKALLLMQYFMLGLLIVGRWLLPRGTMSQDQLSRLLLIQIGIAGDIADFFNSLVDPSVQCDFNMALIILALWTWSMVQFIFVYPSSSLQASYTNILDRFRERNKDLDRSVLLNPEVSGTLVSLFMQDLPYFACRIWFTLWSKSLQLDEDMQFFLFKNGLSIILAVFRLIFIKRDIERIRFRRQYMGGSATVINLLQRGNRRYSLFTTIISKIMGISRFRSHGRENWPVMARLKSMSRSRKASEAEDEPRAVRDPRRRRSGRLHSLESPSVLSLTDSSTHSSSSDSSETSSSTDSPEDGTGTRSTTGTMDGAMRAAGELMEESLDTWRDTAVSATARPSKETLKADMKDSTNSSPSNISCATLTESSPDPNMVRRSETHASYLIDSGPAPGPSAASDSKAFANADRSAGTRVQMQGFDMKANRGTIKNFDRLTNVGTSVMRANRGTIKNCDVVTSVGTSVETGVGALGSETQAIRRIAKNSDAVTNAGTSVETYTKALNYDRAANRGTTMNTNAKVNSGTSVETGARSLDFDRRANTNAVPDSAASVDVISTRAHSGKRTVTDARGAMARSRSGPLNRIRRMMHSRSASKTDTGVTRGKKSITNGENVEEMRRLPGSDKALSATWHDAECPTLWRAPMSHMIPSLVKNDPLQSPRFTTPGMNERAGTCASAATFCQPLGLAGGTLASSTAEQSAETKCHSPNRLQKAYFMDAPNSCPTAPASNRRQSPIDVIQKISSVTESNLILRSAVSDLKRRSRELQARRNSTRSSSNELVSLASAQNVDIIATDGKNDTSSFPGMPGSNARSVPCENTYTVAKEALPGCHENAEDSKSATEILQSTTTDGRFSWSDETKRTDLRSLHFLADRPGAECAEIGERMARWSGSLAEFRRKYCFPRKSSGLLGDANAERKNTKRRITYVLDIPQPTMSIMSPHSQSDDKSTNFSTKQGIHSIDSSEQKTSQVQGSAMPDQKADRCFLPVSETSGGRAIREIGQTDGEVTAGSSPSGRLPSDYLPEDTPGRSDTARGHCDEKRRDVESLTQEKHKPSQINTVRRNKENTDSSKGVNVWWKLSRSLHLLAPKKKKKVTVKKRAGTKTMIGLFAHQHDGSDDPVMNFLLSAGMSGPSKTSLRPTSTKTSTGRDSVAPVVVSKAIISNNSEKEDTSFDSGSTCTHLNTKRDVESPCEWIVSFDQADGRRVPGHISLPEKILSSPESFVSRSSGTTSTLHCRRHHQPPSRTWAPQTRSGRNMSIQDSRPTDTNAVYSQTSTGETGFPRSSSRLADETDPPPGHAEDESRARILQNRSASMLPPHRSGTRRNGFSQTRTDEKRYSH